MRCAHRDEDESRVKSVAHRPNPLPHARPTAWFQYNLGMKLALIGTHGVGKTTLCFELAARLKRRGLDVEIVREVARRCPLPINEQTTVRAQEWILLTQMALEIEATAAHEIVLCDRSVLDNYCYLVHAAGTQPLWERVLDDWIPTYDLLVWVPQWSSLPTIVRAVDPDFQRRIE
jgi:thymidylate kinase